MKTTSFYFSTCLFCLFFVMPDTLLAQAKKGLVIPMSAYEYYTLDSSSFYYNYSYALSNAIQCNALQSPKLEAQLSLEQKALVSMVGANPEGEGSSGILGLLHNTSINKDELLSGLRSMGAVEMASYLQSVEPYMAALAKSVEAGEETRMAELYRYDSIYYDFQMRELGNFHRYIRSSNLVINPEGKPFDNNFSGFYKVMTPSGKVAETVRLRNGSYDGMVKVYNPNNTVLSEEFTDKEKQVRIAFTDKGKPISTDTTFLKDNSTHSTSHFPSGKLSSRYISRPESGYFKEWSYYENGKLAFVKEQEKYLEAYDEKGNSTFKDGSGSFTQISMDPLTNSVYKTVAELKNNVLEGSYKSYLDGKLVNQSTYKNGQIVGKMFTYHPLNGKKLAQYTYTDQGEYVEDGYKEFVENYPSIKEAKIKVTTTFVTNFTCMNLPSQQKGFVSARCENAGLLDSTLKSDPKILFGDSDVLPEMNSNMYYQQLIISETGKASTNGIFSDEAMEKIFQQLVFTPATLNGKPIPSMLDVNYLVRYY